MADDGWPGFFRWALEWASKDGVTPRMWLVFGLLLLCLGLIGIWLWKRPEVMRAKNERLRLEVELKQAGAAVEERRKKSASQRSGTVKGRR